MTPTPLDLKPTSCPVGEEERAKTDRTWMRKRVLHGIVVTIGNNARCNRPLWPGYAPVTLGPCCTCREKNISWISCRHASVHDDLTKDGVYYCCCRVSLSAVLETLTFVCTSRFCFVLYHLHVQFASNLRAQQRRARHRIMSALVYVGVTRLSKASWLDALRETRRKNQSHIKKKTTSNR